MVQNNRKTGLIETPALIARRWPALAASKISPVSVWLGRCLMPAYLRMVLSFRKIDVRTPEWIVDAMHELQEKRIRLIVAFRHPSGDDPQLLFHVFENLVPRYAKKMQKPLLHRPYLRFIHDYAVGLWSGPLIRFFLPRVGALPVYHATCDTASLGNIRKVLKDGSSPVGIASEGQISYHSESLPRLEHGTARIGFWCVKDMKSASRSEDVLILPISVHLQYDIRDLKKITRALNRMEEFCGMNSRSEDASADTLQALPPRIEALESRILDIVEGYYKKSYGYQAQRTPVMNETEPAARQRRWRALFPIALDIAERLLGIDPQDDSIVQRMYRVRLEAWKGIYPYTGHEMLSRLESGLNDRHAGEAWFAMRHMEFVDLMSYHDVDYMTGENGDDVSFDRIVETVTSFEDLINRLLGGNITNRPHNIRKNAVIVPAPSINLTERLQDYCADPKRTVQETTDALDTSFRECIERYKRNDQPE
jgi:hypothetical protein